MTLKEQVTFLLDANGRLEKRIAKLENKLQNKNRAPKRTSAEWVEYFNERINKKFKHYGKNTGV